MIAKPAHRSNPFNFIRNHHPLKSFLSIVLTIAIINLSTGCAHYKVQDLTSSPDDMNQKIADFNKEGYYAIIHSGKRVFHLRQINVDQEKNQLTGTVDSLSPEHQFNAVKKRKKATNRYKRSSQNPFSELHIYINSGIDPTAGEELTITADDIQSISINKPDGLAEFGVIMLATVGVIAAVFGLAVALKSSCPFIYAKDGDTYKFIGELYPGVITENMQRDDYIPLGEWDSETENISVKVTNELKEIQHTDLLELIVVDHPKNTKTLLDKQGRLHTFSKLQLPYNVIADGVNSELESVKAIDDNFYTFNSTTEWTNSNRQLTLEFEAPESPTDAKLYLRTKNTLWLDYMFGKLNEKFGSYYPEFQEQQQKQTKEESEQWANIQNIPLSVYVETAAGWELVDKVNTVGPLAFRNIVVPIDSRFVTNEAVRIKLETGFMFWEVDYAAIDYSENLPLEMNYVLPHEAVDHNNKDVTELLTKQDNIYLTQSEIGDVVTVNYELEKGGEGYTRSVFLKNRGYYNYIREYEGEPDFQALKIFREAGSFTDFSMFEYYALTGIENDQLLASER